MNVFEKYFGMNEEEALASLDFNKGAFLSALAAAGERKRADRELLESLRKRQSRAGWGFVYIIKGTHRGMVRHKIGKANDLKNRLATFNVKLPFDIEPVASFYVERPLVLEREMHEMMRVFHVNGEWFDLSPEAIWELSIHGMRREMDDTVSLLASFASEEDSLGEMPDATYIEYLESMLVMNGIEFSRRKPG